MQLKIPKSIDYMKTKFPLYKLFSDSQMNLTIVDTFTSGQKKIPLNMHNHIFEELVIVCNGSAVHVTNDTECRVSSGDVFFIPVDYSHGFYGFDKYEAINIVFFRDRLNLPNADLEKLAAYYALFELEPELRAGRGSAPCLTLDSKELTMVKNIAEKIKKEQVMKKVAYQYRVLSLFMEIEVFLVRCYEKIESDESIVLLRLGKLMTFLEHNYHKKMTSKDMAKIAKTSERTLNRLCCDMLGSPPKKYLLDLRLSKAKQILQKEKVRVAEVAFRVGFSDSNYFTKQYKKKFKCTPKESAKRRPAKNSI